MQQIEVDGLVIELAQKKMRNIYIRIYPGGKVVVSAPLRVSLADIKKFIVKKIDWIKTRQEELKKHRKVEKPKYLSGENHYFLGKKYCLKIVENAGFSKVVLSEDFIEIYFKKDASTIKKRKKVLLEWYRGEIKKLIPNYIEIYEKIMNVKVREFGVKQMKTRWGTCNIKDRRIWINLELAKKSLICLEYIVVHEMVHLLEKNHTKKFHAYMDFFMPNWKEGNGLLKSSEFHVD